MPTHDTGKMLKFFSWLRLQLGTTYLTLLRLRNTFFYLVWPRVKARVRVLGLWLERHPQWMYHSKKIMLGCCLAVVMLAIAIGPLWTLARHTFESWRATAEYKKIQTTLSRKEVHGRMLQAMSKQVAALLSEGCLVDAQWHLPYHTAAYDKSSHIFFGFEKRSTPQDIALYMAYSLAKLKKGKDDVAQRIALLKQTLGTLAMWQNNHPDYQGLYPTLVWPKEKLQAEDMVLDLAQNAYLSWVLAVVANEMKNERRDELKLLATDVQALAEGLLALQNYACFWDAKQQVCYGQVALNGAMAPKKLADNAWTEAVLGPLWMSLNGALSVAEKKALAKQLRLLTVVYAADNDEAFDVPLTDHGSLADVQPLLWLLPVQSLGAVQQALQQEVWLQAHYAKEHRYAGFQGDVYSKEGVLQHHGINRVALHPEAVAGDWPVHAAVTVASLALFPDAGLQAWATLAWSQSWPKEMIAVSDASLMGIALAGGFQGMVQQMLESTKRRAAYEDFWANETEELLRSKPKQQLYGLANKSWPKPTRRTLHMEDVNTNRGEHVPLLRHVQPKVLDVHSDDRMVAVRKGDTVEISFRLTRPATLRFMGDYEHVRIKQMSNLRMNYEWTGIQDGVVSMMLKKRELSLNVPVQRRLSSGVLQWEKSSWQSLVWPLVAWDRHRDEGFSALDLKLTPLKQDVWEGTLVIQSIEGFVSEEPGRGEARPFYRHYPLPKHIKPVGEGYALNLLKAQAMGNANPNTTQVYGDVVLCEYERCDEGLSWAGVAMDVQGSVPEEHPVRALSFDVHGGTIGAMPGYVQVEATCVDKNKEHTFFWNMAFPTHKAGDGEWVHVFLPLTSTKELYAIKHVALRADLRINKNPVGSLVVANLRVHDSRQLQAWAAPTDRAVYRPKDLWGSNMLVHLSVPADEDVLQLRDGRLLFTEDVNKKGVCYGVFYPEQVLSGKALLLHFGQHAYPDASFRLSFYCRGVLVWESDVPVMYGGDDPVWKIWIPHSLTGVVVDQVSFSRVQGVVDLRRLAVE